MADKKKSPETSDEREKRLRDREFSDIRTVVGSSEGRRLYWRILKQSGIFHEGYVHGDQGYGTTRNEGRRSLGTWALNELLGAKPDAFNQMQREHNSEETKDERMKEKQIEDVDILTTDSNPA